MTPYFIPAQSLFGLACAPRKKVFTLVGYECPTGPESGKHLLVSGSQVANHYKVSLTSRLSLPFFLAQLTISLLSRSSRSTAQHSYFQQVFASDIPAKMCFTERIFYQCAHRSLGVLRPCPMTTAGHNFPVCELAPLKPYYAETMCAVCERELHSRWVLIREWEHRWLHERGACGCDVTFPGLLTTPRVIGDTDSIMPAPESVSGSDGDSTPSAEDNEKTLVDVAAALAESSDTGQQGVCSQGAVNTRTTAVVAGDGRIPALYSEQTTASGERHVAVRVASLFAAEWKEDHRGLHESGRCTCSATFAPCQPRVGDEELASGDWENLRRWRELQGGHEMKERNDENRNINDQNEATLRRIAEIEKVFGKFTMNSESPRVNLPRVSGAQVAEVRSQGGSRNSNQRLEKGVGRTQYQCQPAHGYNTRPHGYGQLVPASGPTTSYNSPPPPPYGYPFQYGAAPGYAMYGWNPAQHQQLPQSFNPAYPIYATPATYTDTIPHGAYPWTPSAQKSQTMRGVNEGPGPYRTAGFIYADTAPSVLTPLHPASGPAGPIPVHRRLPAPEQAEEQGHGDKAKGKASDPQQQGEGTAEGSDALPVCGLPIGAGPEGEESHMPSWLGCALRKLPGTEKGRNGGVESEVEDNMKQKDREGDKGSDQGSDKGGSDKEETSPRPTTHRRHSAST